MMSHVVEPRFPRFSPCHTDLLRVGGTMHHKMAPALKRVDGQMCEPPWVVACGACATSGGFSRHDATMQGIDHGFPVDVSMAGCPPRPTAVLEGLLRSQQKVDTADRLDRRTLLRVDGGGYAARRLVPVTPPGQRRGCTRGRRTRAAGVAPVAGYGHGPGSRAGAAHGHLQRCVSTAVHRSAHERSMPPASSPPMRCNAAATKALAHLCLCEAHSAT
jgi:NADH ubiquinone oxidoreductase subunit